MTSRLQSGLFIVWECDSFHWKELVNFPKRYLPGVLKKGSVNCAVFLVIVVGKLFKPVWLDVVKLRWAQTVTWSECKRRHISTENVGPQDLEQNINYKWTFPWSFEERIPNFTPGSLPSLAHYLLGGAPLPESVETSRPIGLTVDTLWGSLSLNLGGERWV